MRGGREREKCRIAYGYEYGGFNVNTESSSPLFRTVEKRVRLASMPLPKLC
jgi:hypothetical protein